MPAFRYEAVDAAGLGSKGVVHADSPRAARADLRARGLVPLGVEAITGQLDASGQVRARRVCDKRSTCLLNTYPIPLNLKL